MITLEAVYVIMGLLAGGVAIVNLRDPSNPKRYNNAIFWGLYAITFLAGLILSGVGCKAWAAVGFGALVYSHTLRLVSAGVTRAAIGFQTILSRFFMSGLAIKRS